MTDYYSILSKAVASLNPNTAQTRAALFDRAKGILVNHIRNQGWKGAEAEAEVARFNSATRRIDAVIARGLTATSGDQFRGCQRDDHTVSSDYQNRVGIAEPLSRKEPPSRKLITGLRSYMAELTAGVTRFIEAQRSTINSVGQRSQGAAPMARLGQKLAVGLRSYGARLAAFVFRVMDGQRSNTVNSVEQGTQNAFPKPQPGQELAASLGSCKSALIALAVASALINVLYLTGSIYMLEVYDRVLTSRSIPTLIGLSVLVFVLFGFQGFLDLQRGRVLIRIARYLGQSLAPRVYELIPRLALATRATGDGLHPMRDLDQIRAFLSSGGPVAFLDLPWMPFYVAICFAFHFWIGVTALGGAIIIVVITVLTDFMTREPQKATTELGGRRQTMAEESRRNAEVLQAMGMRSRVAALWGDVNAKFLDSYQRSSDVSSSFGALSKVFRTVLQSAVLGVGAYLVIVQEASAGIIIAGSILSARALAPVDLAIANWKGFVSARQSWQRLSNLLSKLPSDNDQMELPKPVGTLTVENVSVVPPGDQRLVLQDASFRLEKGSALGVVGPSAGGKSSLVRALVGVWPAARGTIRLDGATLDQWSSETLGCHIGYLPQSVELLSGTIAQNIARFDRDATSGNIIAAARAAGVHELVLHLPDGYATDIGENGSILSAGQRQRIALARALYGDPFLVVLDEPNSNLDSDGEEALTKAILGVRARGGLIILVAHRGNVLASVDQMMVINQGRVQVVGPRDEVLAKLRRPVVASAAAGLRVVSESAGAAS